MAQDIVRTQVTGALENALKLAKARNQLQLDPMPHVSLDPPKRPEWGDLASSVALGLSKREHRPPLEVASIISDHLKVQDEVFERVDVVTPGFLNMTVRRGLWLKVLHEIEEQGATYGQSDVGVGTRVLVEFVSANPTGPLHVGHGRGAALGEALSRLLTAAGYTVEREYYINDAGRQMKLLGASVWARYQAQRGRSVPFPEDGYRGAYLESVAQQIGEEVGDRLLGASEAVAEDTCQTMAYRELLHQIKVDLESFGIQFDSWCSEAGLIAAGGVVQALDDLQARHLLFEDEGALWFRASDFGDEKDRVVRKQDWEYTYLASDIAYHRDKLRRGFGMLVDVWGADHHGYIPRMRAVVEALGYSKQALRVPLVQMVHLVRGGKKVEMSKRAGEFITLREVIEEVGADAAKFFFLMHRSDTHLDFDLDLAKAQSADNPVYYVQYAHARVSSVCRVAGERGVPIPLVAEVNLDVLTHSDELTLIRKLSAYPSVIHNSAVSLEPHRITSYLQELAALLHTFYFKHRILPAADGGGGGGEGKDVVRDPHVAVTRKSRDPVTPDLTAARLVLIRQVQRVLQNGLGMLGVTAPERM